MKKSLFIIASLLLAVSVIAASSTGTPDEAKALVVKAVAFLKANGNEKAFAEFNNPKGQFIDRDLYIYVVEAGNTSKCLAHGTNGRLIGQTVIDFKDTDGKFFIREIIRIANDKGSGWVDYKWTHPTTKNIEPKTAYFEKVNNLILICGAYKAK